MAGSSSDVITSEDIPTFNFKVSTKQLLNVLILPGLTLAFSMLCLVGLSALSPFFLAVWLGVKNH